MRMKKNNVHRLPRNTRGTDYVVGDIHGMFSLLDAALMRVGFNRSTDRLIAAGDMIDRGPESERVREFLEQPWFFAVRGNHEENMIQCLSNDGKHPSCDTVVSSGGVWIAGMTEAERSDIRFALEALPYAIEIATATSRVGVVHADVRGDDWDKFISRLELDCLATRQHATESRLRAEQIVLAPVAGVERVFCGHDHDAPERVGNVHFLDRGACFGGPLTIARADGEIVARVMWP